MAIALDTSVDGGIVAGVNTLSYTHTCTGSQLILFVGVRKFAGDVTGVTYNNVAMTQITTKQDAGTGFIYLFYIINPTTGANTIKVSATGTGTIRAMSASYTGASQSGQPDNFSTAAGNFSSNTLNGASVTTIADNCWTIMFSYSSGTGAAVVGDATTNVLQQASTTLTDALSDSNGVVHPAGSRTMTVRAANGTQNWSHIIASFSPSLASAAVPTKRYIMQRGQTRFMR